MCCPHSVGFWSCSWTCSLSCSWPCLGSWTCSLSCSWTCFGFWCHWAQTVPWYSFPGPRPWWHSHFYSCVIYVCTVLSHCHTGLTFCHWSLCGISLVGVLDLLLVTLTDPGWVSPGVLDLFLDLLLVLDLSEVWIGAGVLDLPLDLVLSACLSLGCASLLCGLWAGSECTFPHAMNTYFIGLALVPLLGVEVVGPLPLILYWGKVILFHVIRVALTLTPLQHSSRQT